MFPCKFLVVVLILAGLMAVGAKPSPFFNGVVIPGIGTVYGYLPGYPQGYPQEYPSYYPQGNPSYYPQGGDYPAEYPTNDSPGETETFDPSTGPRNELPWGKGESRAVPINKFHSDVIVTYWPTTPATKENGVDEEANEPGFMRKQLMKFGQVASNVGNAMGAHATKITSAVDKMCEIVKLIIPLLAAICHVGQFKFCAATTSAPTELSVAMSPNNFDLNIPDK